jgi:hypothetical protein
LPSEYARRRKLRARRQLSGQDGIADLCANLALQGFATITSKIERQEHTFAPLELGCVFVRNARSTPSSVKTARHTVAHLVDKMS